jgi:methionyl-tRNA synthetase
MAKRTLVTCALPYANGPVHMGHIAGVYLPGDIYTRYLRLLGEECIFVCGTDDHGVPITISADAEDCTPADIVAKYHAMQTKAFEGLGVEFDIFSGTSTCSYHRDLSQEFFVNLEKSGHVEPKVTAQYFCARCDRFLPDRYVEGRCPFCGAEDARGDQCDVCTNALDSLKDPRCKICGRRPEKRKTRHWFFRLDKFQDMILDWIGGKNQWKDNVRRFATQMIHKGLKPRSITRDLSWGVPVPTEDAEGKVLYVWFDAPVGYISFTKELGEARGESDLWRRYWKDDDTRLVHFIGKDNIVFHAVIWPAMLMGQKEYILPAEIPAFEFLNFKGGKFSKSKKRALWVHDYLARFPADMARYYLTVIAPETKDTNWTWETFATRVNTELADVLGNFVNRTLTFSRKRYDGAAPASGPGPAQGVLDAIRLARDEMDRKLGSFHFKASLAAVMELAREGNRIFEHEKPWETVRSDPDRCAATLASSLEIVHALGVLLHPYIPHTTVRIRAWLGEDPVPGPDDWKALGDRAVASGAALGEPEILFEKVDLESMEEGEMTDKPEKTKTPASPPTVSFEEFGKLDLRVAEIRRVVPVKKADKLYEIEIDLGQETRTIVAGMRPYYPDPEALIGKRIVVVANLEPAKIRGILSTAMLLAAEADGRVTFLVPEGDMPPGASIS